MDELLNIFKKNLYEGKTVYGIFSKSKDPAFIEASGYAGLNFIILDMEHGSVGYENLENLVRAAYLAGLIPVVRVQNGEESFISRALDTGASGVQVPQVLNAKVAKAVLKASKFYPLGERGMCRFVKAAKYSALDKKIYFNTANNSLVILQIEGKSAIEEIDDILSVNGYDIIFIGPYDLSQSLGVPGEINHPEVVRQMKIIVYKSKKANKIVGTFTDSPSQAKLWREAGVQYIAYSVDVGIYYDACKQLVEKLS